MQKEESVCRFGKENKVCASLSGDVKICAPSNGGGGGGKSETDECEREKNATGKVLRRLPLALESIFRSLGNRFRYIFVRHLFADESINHLKQTKMTRLILLLALPRQR